MDYQRGIDVVVVGYHQPDDATAFHDALLAVSDLVPWDAWYVSVEATIEDIKIGNDLWGGSRHLIDFTNIGHAAACNLAAPLGYHDTIFFCNADTRLYSGVMDRCYRTLWSEPAYGAVGPRQIDESGRITAGGIFGTQEQPRHRGWMESGPDYQDFRDDAIVVSGSLFMIKRTVWDLLAECPAFRQADPQAAGAMPSVRHYYSETWPSYHLAAHGYKNVYEGRVTARHDWHKASIQGGFGEQNMSQDKAHFQRLCDIHGIPHD